MQILLELAALVIGCGLGLGAARLLLAGVLALAFRERSAR